MYTNNLNLKTIIDKSNNILVIGQRCMQQEVVRALETDYQIITHDGQADLSTLVMNHTNISCIIIEYTQELLPQIYILKKNFQTCFIPIIALVSTVSHDTINEIMQAGIDDFIHKPLDALQLRMRLYININRALHNQNANPLTKLPGNELVSITIAQRLNQLFAMVYVDLDHFKAYNDVYGFAQGDQLLLALAQILVHTTQTLGNSSDFIGHVGGDDFVIISTPDKAELIAQEVCRQFDQSAPSFYTEHDQIQKKIITINRQGNTQEFPLITLSCALVSNALRTLNSVAQISQIVTELKRYAKSKPHGITCSNYVQDRRTK